MTLGPFADTLEATASFVSTSCIALVLVVALGTGPVDAGVEEDELEAWAIGSIISVS